MATFEDNLGRSRPMSHIREQLNLTSTPGVVMEARSLSTGQTVYVMIAGNSGEANRVANTAVYECNEQEDDKYQACAFYCSALVALFPTLLPVVTDAFRSLGRTVTTLPVNELAAYGIDLMEEVDSQLLLVYMGQLILILYKNISPRSYATLMRNATRALKAHAAYDGPVAGGEAEPILSTERASQMKILIGGDDNLRKYVLYAILNNRNTDGPMGRVCQYLSGIIAWTEMAYLTTILETLVVPKSPVLLDHRVAPEVLNLYEANKEISKSSYPQYFRILHPRIAARLLEKNRFPVLISVAQRIRGERQNNASVNDGMVTALVRIHEDAMVRKEPAAQN